MGLVSRLRPYLPEDCLSLLSHWDRVRGDRIIPNRGDIHPGEIKHLLPFLSIFEFNSFSSIPIRLAGTALYDLFGFELTGRNRIELASPDHRPVLAYRQMMLLHQPCGGRFTRRIEFGWGNHQLTTGIMLPLLSDRAGGAPLSLNIEVPTNGARWINRRSHAVVEMHEDWHFFDIGSGVPAEAYPAETWESGTIA